MDGSIEFSRMTRLLPPILRSMAAELPEHIVSSAEEIRLRVGQAPAAVIGDREVTILPEHIVTAAELQLSLEIATRASVHTYSDSIKMGFVTAEGGCRLGLCGTAVTEGGEISNLRRLSSICIRIPREKKGCADEVFKEVTENGYKSTLILSPPGAGKTTLLRDLVRQLSESGKRISLIDERSEIAGTFEGKPCFEVGRRTDILTGAPKTQGIYLVLRSMSPQIIAFDEITAPGDVIAAEMSANCGVELLATAHGASLEDLAMRPLYRRLLEQKIFKRVITITTANGKRSYKVEELQ